MRALKSLAIVVVIVLSGCASIPISTALKLSSMTPQSLAQIDPNQVRLKLSVPVGYDLDIPGARLKFDFKGQNGSRAASMDLSLLQITHDQRSGGLFNRDIPVNTYLLALSPNSINQLKEVQHLALASKSGQFSFAVSAPFEKLPPNTREITFWADLKLSRSEPYRPLIDGAKLQFKD